MGRKSKATERTNQILDAFEQCIVTYGFEGATLQRTADAAGVNLGMIHHYIGRKDDLLNAMIDRFRAQIEAEMAEFDLHVAEDERLPALLSFFFSAEPDEDDQLIDALFASGAKNPTVQAAIDSVSEMFASIWSAEIGRIHPDLPTQRCTEIAFAVLGLAYGSDLLPSGKVRKEMWRDSAETLIRHP